MIFTKYSASLSALALIFTALSAQTETILAKANPAESNQYAQKTTRKQKVVVVSGARFSYKLVQKFIDDYNAANPEVQIIIEARGSSDPANVDILAEVFPQDEAIRKEREYVNVGRYAILPVAASISSFAKIYSETGLTRELINQLYFHDLFADSEKEQKIKASYTIYTRLQRAGVPIVFTKYFGYEQKDIKGKAIAGSDEHLLKALLRDSTAVSYLPLPLIYDQANGDPIAGLTVLPVDLNGNRRVNDDEKFYSKLSEVIQHLESKGPKEIKNIPIEYLHLSIDKKNASTEAIEFLKWVSENAERYLHDFGYFKSEENHVEKNKFNEFASKRGK
jgi:ABC-type phosphate transport system substrate-binding protein